MKDLTLEHEVLATFINSAKAQLHITECTEEFFTEIETMAIFRCIQQLSNAGEPIDLLTVSLKMGKLQFKPVITAQIAAKYVSDSGIEYKIKVLHQLYIQRNLAKIAKELEYKAQDSNNDPFTLMADTQRKMDELGVINRTDGVHIHKVAVDRVNDIAKRKAEGIRTLGVPSGWETLDKFTGGLVPGEFWVVAGRPGMGKTSWATALSIRHSLTGNKVAFFSLEMTKEGLVDRILSAEYSINGEYIRTANLSQEQLEAMARLQNIARMGIYIDDTRRQTIDQIRAKVKMMKAKHQISMVVIDYLGLINPHDARAIREQQVAYISRQCKLIAGESNVTVIALSQLNRNSESRSDKRPGLADLRESGAIEQDADLVIFPFRPAYYDNDKPLVEEAETIIAKNRNGRTGIIPCKFESQFSNYIF